MVAGVAAASLAVGDGVSRRFRLIEPRVSPTVASRHLYDGRRSCRNWHSSYLLVLHSLTLYQLKPNRYPLATAVRNIARGFADRQGPCCCPQGSSHLWPATALSAKHRTIISNPTTAIAFS